jgi:hypothetical protein
VEGSDMKIHFILYSILLSCSTGSAGTFPFKSIECVDKNPTSQFSAYLTTDNAVTQKYYKRDDAIPYATINQRNPEGVFQSGQLFIVQQSEKLITLEDSFNGSGQSTRLVLHQPTSGKNYSGFLTSGFEIYGRWIRITNRPVQCSVLR